MSAEPTVRPDLISREFRVLRSAALRWLIVIVLALAVAIKAAALAFALTRAPLAYHIPPAGDSREVIR